MFYSSVKMTAIVVRDAGRWHRIAQTSHQTPVEMASRDVPRVGSVNRSHSGSDQGTRVTAEDCVLAHLF